MKKSYIYLTIGLVVGGILLSPVFVSANNICYVDKKADDDGDGSDDKPYQKISKATEKDCDEIKISKGTYEEDVSLKKGVNLRGSSKEDVVIKGKITMGNGSELSRLTVSGGGVSLSDGADVDIEGIRIKDANIGITTLGKGKITVNDTAISGNRKGLYIQYGKNVKITNCKIYDNKEEGLDIRANVNGSINNNEIYSNGESGIEVILGKAQLSIVNNEIKKNGASGIAAQFYSDTDKLGDVVIKNNVIIGNSNYGLDCKAPSGGDGRPKGYWMDSMDLSSNKIIENKKKDISGGCKFDEETIADATKTKEEREAEKKALEEKEKQHQLSLLEKQKLEELKRQQEEEEKILAKDREEKAGIDVIYQEIENALLADEALKSEIKNRNKTLIFFLGEDYKNIKKLQERLSFYDEKIELIEDRRANIVNESILIEVDSQLATLREKRENIVNFIAEQGDKFSLWGWIFKEIYLSQDKKFLIFF